MANTKNTLKDLLGKPQIAEVPLKSTRGRGGVKKEVKRDKKITVYLIEAEYELIFDKARELGISSSDFLRLRGLGKLSDEG